MKRILVPIDFSEHSNNALDCALMFAEKFSAELLLTNIVEMPVTAVGYGMTGDWMNVPGAVTPDLELLDSLISSGKENMQKLIASPKLKDAKVSYLVEQGSIELTIDELCRAQNIDLIIMGTSGSDNFGSLLFDSTAEKVVETALVPVLLIRDKMVALPQTILFATDFSKETDFFFRKVKEFAESVNAKLKCVYVNTVENFQTSQEIKDKMTPFIDRYKMEIEMTIYDDVSEEEGIENFAKEIKADIIAIGTHGRGSLSRFFNPSISADVVNHSPVPVLTIIQEQKK